VKVYRRYSDRWQVYNGSVLILTTLKQMEAWHAKPSLLPLNTDESRVWSSHLNIDTDTVPGGAVDCRLFQLLGTSSGYRVQGSGLRVQGLGFRIQDLGFRVQGSGFRVQGSRFKVQGSGLRVRSLGFRVQGSRFKVQGSRFKVQGSGVRGQGSGFRVQGSGFRTHLPLAHQLD